MLGLGEIAAVVCSIALGTNIMSGRLFMSLFMLFLILLNAYLLGWFV